MSGNDNFGDDDDMGGMGQPQIVFMGGDDGEIPQEILDSLPPQLLAMMGIKREPVGDLNFDVYHAHDPADHEKFTRLHSIVELPRGVDAESVTVEAKGDQGFILVKASRAAFAGAPEGDFCQDVHKGITTRLEARLPSLLGVRQDQLAVTFNKEAGLVSVDLEITEEMRRVHEEKSEELAAKMELMQQMQGRGGFGGPSFGGPTGMN